MPAAAGCVKAEWRTRPWYVLTLAPEPDVTRYDTLRDRDDEPTLSDSSMPELTAPTYESAPPTLEARPSPFHAPSATAPGMPPVVTFQPPRIISAPVENLAGPTVPDGYPLPAIGDGPTDPELGPSPWAPKKPVVPEPAGPNILVSQSLMLESEVAEEEARRAAAVAPVPVPVKPRKPSAALPTEVLPSLKKPVEKEGSDWPLILGLLALALVIAGVVGAVAYGVVRTINEPATTPAPAAAQP